MMLSRGSRMQSRTAAAGGVAARQEQIRRERIAPLLLLLPWVSAPSPPVLFAVANYEKLTAWVSRKPLARGSSLISECPHCSWA